MRPAWQAVYFGMVIEPDEKIILGLCKVSLMPEYLAVCWASAVILALAAGTQLLRLPFLECWGAGMTSAKHGNCQAPGKLSAPGRTGQS